MKRTLAACALALGFVAGPAWADTMLHVSVTANVTVMPDELVAQLNATADAPTAAAAQEQVNRMVQAALASAKPVSGITTSTTAYSVWHETDPKDVWHASQGIALRSHDGAGLLTLVGTLQGSGLAVGDLSWQVSPPLSETTYEAAIAKGVAVLMARAHGVAQLMHLQVEDFRSVTVGDDGAAAPRPMMMRAMAMEKTVTPPNAQADIVTVSATVSGDARLVPAP